VHCERYNINFERYVERYERMMAKRRDYNAMITPSRSASLSSARYYTSLCWHKVQSQIVMAKMKIKRRKIRLPIARTIKEMSAVQVFPKALINKQNNSNSSVQEERRMARKSNSRIDPKVNQSQYFYTIPMPKRFYDL